MVDRIAEDLAAGGEKALDIYRITVQNVGQLPQDLARANDWKLRRFWPAV
jgi:hypothetical protein